LVFGDEHADARRVEEGESGEIDDHLTTTLVKGGA
jgi:hypothetical protein